MSLNEALDAALDELDDDEDSNVALTPSTEKGGSMDKKECEADKSMASVSKSVKENNSKKKTSNVKSSSDSGYKETIDDLLKDIAKPLEDSAFPGIPGNEMDMLQSMMADLQRLSGEGGDLDEMFSNPDQLVEGMMSELLSKDLMYEPVKQVAEAFPAWLDENKDKLPEEELKQ